MIKVQILNLKTPNDGYYLYKIASYFTLLLTISFLIMESLVSILVESFGILTRKQLTRLARIQMTLLVDEDPQSYQSLHLTHFAPSFNKKKNLQRLKKSELLNLLSDLVICRVFLKLSANPS